MKTPNIDELKNMLSAHTLFLVAAKSTAETFRMTVRNQVVNYRINEIMIVKGEADNVVLVCWLNHGLGACHWFLVEPGVTAHMVATNLTGTGDGEDPDYRDAEDIANALKVYFYLMTK